MKNRRMVMNLIITVSFAAFFVLCLPTKRFDIRLFGGFLLAAYVALMYYLNKKCDPAFFEQRIPIDLYGIFASAVIEAYALIVFQNQWKGSERYDALVSFFRLDTDVSRWIIGGLCVLFSIAGVYLVLFHILRKQRRIVVLVLVLLFAVFELQLLLEYTISIRRVYALPINFLFLYFLYLLFNLPIRRWKISLLIVCTFSTIMCLINYYVILFHGSPFFPGEFANIPTAISVLPGYKLSIDRNVIRILVMYGVQLALILLLYWKKEGAGEPQYSFKRQVCQFLAVLAVLYVAVFSPVSVDNKGINHQMWAWRKALRFYGYYWCALNDLRNVVTPMDRPDGYDAEALSAKEQSDATRTSDGGEYPDIILILNETFCDLGEYCTLDTDHDFMEGYYGIPGATYGHAIVPFVGGGTNNTEMELLTSNSMHLLKANAPFNYLNLDGLDSSVARHLDTLGYETTAMHCMEPSNYSRNRAYPELGFERVVLGRDNYVQNSYGERIFLDEDNYSDMLALYEKADAHPQFFYMLTYQNHGGFRQNDDALDLIHVTNDYGEMTDKLNEYLTSVSMSAKAFRGLTEHLSKQSRPVIVCMMGDHAPSFINSIGAEMMCSPQDPEIAQRTVPLVIWSNFDLKLTEDVDYVTATDLMPVLLDAANLPMTTYQKSILSLHEELPVRTSNGYYLDHNGRFGRYAPDDPYYDLITDYYCMEYNALDRGDDYKKELFILK